MKYKIIEKMLCFLMLNIKQDKQDEKYKLLKPISHEELDARPQPRMN